MEGPTQTEGLGQNQLQIMPVPVGPPCNKKKKLHYYTTIPELRSAVLGQPLRFARLTFLTTPPFAFTND